jgi:hypothetical protein
MTAADTNVRPGWRGNATTARGAGGSLLARLLLYFRKHLTKLDRKPLLLLLAASLTPACIIPVGPEFQDPPGAPNSPPTVVATDPPAGTITANPMVVFSVTPADANVLDPLYVKWIADYPPFVPNETHGVPPKEIPPSADGSVRRPPQTFQPGCFSSIATTRTMHQIQVGISDRQFLTDEDPNDLFATTDGSKPYIVTWFLIRSCLF